jgi:hypothetical protein
MWLFLKGEGCICRCLFSRRVSFVVQLAMQTAESPARHRKLRVQLFP